MLLFGLSAWLLWIPSVMVHAQAGRSFSSPHVLLLTISMPILSVGVLALAAFVAKRFQIEFPGALISSLLGIWVLGPVAMLISANMAGGGLQQGDLLSALALLLVFPAATFSMSAYDGSFFGLLLATGVLLMALVAWLVKTWIRPPGRTVPKAFSSPPGPSGPAA